MTMKILFKVIVFTLGLTCCFALWKLHNSFYINLTQFALAYGLIVLFAGLVIGLGTDYNFKNQSKYDNREKDPLSDWVKIQDRAKGRNAFWKGLLSDSDMDERLQWELANNYYDRNELKTAGQIVKETPSYKNAPVFWPAPFSIIAHNEAKTLTATEAKQALEQLLAKGRPTIREPYERYAGYFYEQDCKALIEFIDSKGRAEDIKPKNTFRPIVVADEVHKVTTEQVSGRINCNVPKWVNDEVGDSLNPLNHEQSK